MSIIRKYKILKKAIFSLISVTELARLAIVILFSWIVHTYLYFSFELMTLKTNKISGMEEYNVVALSCTLFSQSVNPV